MHDPALTPAPCTAARTGEQPSAHQQRSGKGDMVHAQQTASPEEGETAPSRPTRMDPEATTLSRVKSDRENKSHMQCLLKGWEVAYVVPRAEKAQSPPL